MNQSKKVWAFVIVISAIIVSVGVLYDAGYFSENPGVNSSGTTEHYPRVDLAGYTLVSQYSNINGNGALTFKVPSNLYAIWIVAYFNSSSGSIIAENSTGSFMGSITMKSGSDFQALQVVALGNSGNLSSKWEMLYEITISLDWNNHVLVYASVK